MGQASCSAPSGCGLTCSHPLAGAPLNKDVPTSERDSEYSVVDARCCGTDSILHSDGAPGLSDQFNCIHEFEIARTKCEQGKYSEAEPMLRGIVTEFENMKDMDDGGMTTLSISATACLADCLSQQGKHVMAEPLHQKALLLADRMLGAEHPETLRALRNLHLCLCQLGKDWEARALQARIEKADHSRQKSPSRTSFQGNLMGVTGSDGSQRIILITDPGQDNDDEMALLLLGELVRRDEVTLLAVVANLRPANRRAALARGTLDMLDMRDVPVGIGTDGGSEKHTDTFSHHISDGMTGFDYFSEPWEAVTQVEQAMGTEDEADVSAKLRIYDGQKLLINVLEEAADQSLTLVLVSSLKDAAGLLRSHEDLFLAKVKCVTIMGGMQVPESPGEGAFPMLEPSDAHNNVFDMEASKFFYLRCQELGIQLVVLSRFTAYGCPVQKKVYDLMVRCPVPHPTVCRLQRAQRNSIETLWANVCDGGKLPARCDKQWFCDTFCCGMGTDRGVGDSMWDLVKTFNMYDPLAVLAALPDKRELFFAPAKHIGPDGTMHLNIGESKESCGIMSDKFDDLHDFMMTTWIRAAGRSCRSSEYTGEEIRPSQLDQEQLTAALTPMTTHTPDEMEELNLNVIRLLDHEWPKLKNSSYLSTWRNRDELMRSIGPSMILVDPDTIRRLGRIPHSAEGKSITMEAAAQKAEGQGRRFFIEMFSHRWHSPYAPDDRYNNKARVLCEWAKYRESMKFETFFWIDYACINQSDIGPGVSMLPLYVSCCHNILCYDTPAYESRSWCRVERMLFTAFVAPNNEFICPDFEYNPYAEKNGTGELKPFYDGKQVVPDPSGEDSQLSYPSDAVLITQLKNLATLHWAKCWKDGLMNIVEEKGGLKEVRKLRYGGTEVRLRKFK